MVHDTRPGVGRRGEELAAANLERLGYVILARGFRTRHGELDLVAVDGDTLVFAEVKTRRGRGEPWDSLHEGKREQVRRMALAFLRECPDRPRTRALRFDAIGVVLDRDGALVRLDHLEGAF